MIGIFIYGLTVKDDSLVYHMRKLSAEVENLKRTFDEALTPALEKTIKQVERFIDAWKKGESK